MAKGDVILVRFPFTNLSGDELRPAVILIDSPHDLTVCFITSQLKWAEPTDIKLPASDAIGIKQTSLIRIQDSYH